MSLSRVRKISSPSVACLGLAALALALSSCAPAAPAAEPGARAPEEPAAEAPPADDEIDEETARLIAESERAAEEESAASGAGGPAPAPAADGSRDVTYRVRQDGIRVLTLGAEFQPEAKIVRRGGGYALELTVLASTKSDLSLLSGEDGPIALAAKYLTEGDRIVADERSKDEDLLLTAEAPQTWKRTWPGPKEKPLQPGQKIELRAGLWSIGPVGAERRPLKKFFVVHVEVKYGGGTARIEVPE